MLALPPTGPGRELPATTLELRGVRATRASLELRIFFDQEGAGPATPTEGNPRYAGSLFFYGHGDGAPLAAPMVLRLEVTEALQARVAAGASVAVTWVAVDNKGREIAAPEIAFDAMVLLASD
ncbi:MAG: hypothetical protein ABJE95_26895 [Byssovorax sp.]